MLRKLDLIYKLKTSFTALFQSKSFPTLSPGCQTNYPRCSLSLDIRHLSIDKMIVDKSTDYSNPLYKLQNVMHAAMFRAQNIPFVPTDDVIKSSQGIFQSSIENKVQTMKGVVQLADLPKHELSEVAFAGRSNSGKSSLIKSLLFDEAGLKIQVSKTPGRTKVLKFYTIGKKFALVDMPGYGENMPEYYVSSVEKYLKTRSQLVRSFLLIDADVGMEEVDIAGLEMMEGFGHPYAIVYTKIDNVSDSRLVHTIVAFQRLKKKLPGCFPQPFLVSAVTGSGIAFLRTFIAYSTGNIAIK